MAVILLLLLLLRMLLPAGIDLAPIVLGALILVVEDRISVGDLLELFLGLRVAGIEVRMQLLGELAVGLGNTAGVRRLRHTKNGIKILCHRPI